MKRIFCAQNISAPDYYLALNGAEGDLSFDDQPAEGVTLNIALQTNGTPRIVSKDSRLSVEISSGTLRITVPSHLGNAPLQYDPVVLGLAEDGELRVRITILQHEAALPPVEDYQITLANATLVGLTFQDSEGTVVYIDSGLNETVTIGGAPCVITFDGYVQSVSIVLHSLPGSAWARMDIEANRPYPIDTAKWLTLCRTGRDYFSVLG